MINIFRHPLWGRNHEGYGEDPFLSGELTEQIVKGMQGDDPRYALIAAGCKHFAAFDGPGNAGEVDISGSDWLGTYMPPFEKCFDAGALSTMCTYAKLNGTYGCQNAMVQNDWLRGRMGFKGYVVSDQGAIHDAAKAINSGCDVEDGHGQYTQLVSLVKDGAVAEATIDTALRRLFYVRMRHGEFDPRVMVPYRDESKYGADSYPEELYSNVSLQAAQQSITLLKNDGDVLPISATASVALFGCLVRAQRVGGKIYPDCQVAATAGYDSVTPHKVTATPAVALQALGYDATFVSDTSGAAVTDAAKAADVAVVFIGRAGFEGESGDWCTERTCGDNSDLNLPDEQKTLLADVLAAGTPTVIVMFTTNPFAFAVDGAAAVVHAHYPQLWAGTAVADVLAGVVSPAGRMPYSFITTLKDVGDIGDYKMSGTSKTYRFEQPSKTPPLFPFGFGLSYTTFKYSDLSLPSTAATCEGVVLSVTVTNTGACDSDEVVQAYATWEVAPLSTPDRQLVGFERVHIKAGAVTTVKLDLPAARFALANDSAAVGPLPMWVAAPVRVALSVGGQQPGQATAAPSNVLSAVITISGPSMALASC